MQKDFLIQRIMELADDLIAWEGLSLDLARAAVAEISSHWLVYQGAYRYEGLGLDTILRGVIQNLQNKPSDVCSETTPLSYISTTFYNQTGQASPAPCQAGHQPVPAPAQDTVSRHFDTLSDLPGGCPDSPAGDWPPSWDDSFEVDAGTGLQPNPGPAALAPCLSATSTGHQLPGPCPIDDLGRAGRDLVLAPWPSSFLSVDNALMAWRGDLTAAALPLHETPLQLTAAGYLALHSLIKSRYPLGLRSTGESMHTIRVRADQLEDARLLARELFELASQPDHGQESFPFTMRQQGGLVTLINLNNRDRQTSRQNKLLNELAKCRLTGNFYTLELNNNGAWPDQAGCEELFHELWAGIEHILGDSPAIVLGSLQFSKSGMPHAHLFSEKILDRDELESLVRRAVGSATVDLVIEQANSTEAVCRYILRQSKLHTWKPSRQPKVVEPVLEAAAPEIEDAGPKYRSRRGDGVFSEPLAQDEWRSLKQSLRDLKGEWKASRKQDRLMKGERTREPKVNSVTAPGSVAPGEVDGSLSKNVYERTLSAMENERTDGVNYIKPDEPSASVAPGKTSAPPLADVFKRTLRHMKNEKTHEPETHEPKILEPDVPGGSIDLDDGQILEDPHGLVGSAITSLMGLFEKEMASVNRRFPIHFEPEVEASYSCRHEAQHEAQNDTRLDTVSGLWPP